MRTATSQKISEQLQLLQEIVFFEEGEPLLDGEPGDLKFRIISRPDAQFKRNGNDLKTDLTISLLDALVGFSTEVSSKQTGVMWSLD